MLTNIAPEYFLYTTYETDSFKTEPKETEVKATKSINPYAFADFLAAAPPEALALANITGALAAIEAKSTCVDTPQQTTTDFYEVGHFAGVRISEGPPAVSFETVNISHMHEWLGEHAVIWDRSTKNWTLQGVIVMQPNKAEKQYYFFTKELEEWLRTPEKPKREAALTAILA